MRVLLSILKRCLGRSFFHFVVGGLISKGTCTSLFHTQRRKDVGNEKRTVSHLYLLNTTSFLLLTK